MPVLLPSYFVSVRTAGPCTWPSTTMKCAATTPAANTQNAAVDAPAPDANGGKRLCAGGTHHFLQKHV